MIIRGMSEEEYFARTHELSSTGAKQILRTPREFEYARTHPQAPKAAFDLGSAVHALVLGTGWGIAELHYDSFRTKAAQEERDAARADGLIPVLAKDMHEPRAIAEAVLAYPTSRALFEAAADRELTVTANIDGVPVRCRFDAFADTGNQLIGIDLKTTGTSASAKGFERAIASFGYDVQQGHYQATYEASEGVPCAFVFVAVETTAPHLVQVHQLSEQWRQIGAEKAKRARDIFAACTESGVWPGYPEGVHLLDPPAWHVIEHEMETA